MLFRNVRDKELAAENINPFDEDNKEIKKRNFLVVLAA